MALGLAAPLSIAHATTTPLVMTHPPGPTPTVRVVEAPPEQFSQGPTLTGRTQLLELDDPGKVDAVCAQALGPTWPRGGYWMGCYLGGEDTVVVPAKGAWPSERERQALIAHEMAHARGWVHENDGRYGRPKTGTQAAG